MARRNDYIPGPDGFVVPGPGLDVGGGGVLPGLVPGPFGVGGVFPGGGALGLGGGAFGVGGGAFGVVVFGVPFGFVPFGFSPFGVVVFGGFPLGVVPFGFVVFGLFVFGVPVPGVGGGFCGVAVPGDWGVALPGACGVAVPGFPLCPAEPELLGGGAPPAGAACATTHVAQPRTTANKLIFPTDMMKSLRKFTRILRARESRRWSQFQRAT
jgi:hypothetical protein